MKKPLILALLGALTIAIAVALLLQKVKQPEAPLSRSASSSADAEEISAKETSADESEEESGEVASKTERPRIANSQVTVLGGEGVDEEAILSQLGDSMKTRNEAKAARLIAKLVEELGLSPEQQAELEAYFAEQVEAASGMFGGDADPMVSARAMAALEGKGMDDLMTELLTPEQQEAWTKREEKRAKQAADSSALKGLARLANAIEIRDGQREALYEHFYQKGLAQAQDQSDEGLLGSIVGGMTGGLGIEMDGSFLQTDFTALEEEAGENGGEVNFQELMRAQRERQIENQVNELAPILEEDQLQEYREHLESQGSLLDGVIGAQDAFFVQPAVGTGVE